MFRCVGRSPPGHGRLRQYAWSLVGTSRRVKRLGKGDGGQGKGQRGHRESTVVLAGHLKDVGFHSRRAG